MTETLVIKKLFDIGSQQKEWIILGLASIIELLDFSTQQKKMGCTRTGRYNRNSIRWNETRYNNR